MFQKLFGRKPSPPPLDAIEREALDRQLGPMVTFPTELDFEQALESWGWVGLRDLTPLFASAFGDVFFRGHGAIYMLDQIEGKLKTVASDLSSLLESLASDQEQDELLLAGLVIGARSRGITLDGGECYDFRLHPALGGEMSAKAITKLSFVVCVNIHGQLHDQIRKLPPGTRINKVVIGD